MTPGPRQDPPPEEGDGKRKRPKRPPPSDAQKAALARNRKMRGKIGAAIEEEVELDGRLRALIEQPRHGRRHRVSFSAPWLTEHGGPADQVIELLKETYGSIKGVFATANPLLESFAPTNSIEVVFYAPDKEVEEARLREEYLGGDAGTQALTDTSLALATLGDLVRREDPDEVARRARGISLKATDGLRDLMAVLADAEVEMRVRLTDDEEDESPAIVLPPERSLRILERLDAVSEIPPSTVSVYGVLQGANSRGMGAFEIETAKDVPLDPVFGNYRRPGVVLKGNLTPTARREIKRYGLWDNHVHARIQVIRRRRGSRVKVHALRLMRVDPRYPSAE